jgi:indolepyruvate ferredoxin oxidoreductase beta subunit
VFGALAGAGILPFDEHSYEETIRASGRGVKASLAAFNASVMAAKNNAVPAAGVEVSDHARDEGTPNGPPALLAEWGRLSARIAAMPQQVQDMANAGLRKVVDFQDLAYGAEYLDRIEQIILLDDKPGEKDFALANAAAKYIANAMAYDDHIRVADINTR